MTRFEPYLPEDTEEALHSILEFSFRTAIQGLVATNVGLERTHPEVTRLVDIACKNPETVERLQQDITNGYMALSRDFLRQDKIKSKEEYEDFSTHILLSVLSTMLFLNKIEVVTIDPETQLKMQANAPYPDLDKPN